MQKQPIDRRSSLDIEGEEPKVNIKKTSSLNLEEISPSNNKTAFQKFCTEVDKLPKLEIGSFSTQNCFDVKSLYKRALFYKDKERDFSFLLKLFNKLSRNSPVPIAFNRSLLNFSPLSTKIGELELFVTLKRIADKGDVPYHTVTLQNNRYYLLSTSGNEDFIVTPSKVNFFKGIYGIDTSFNLRISKGSHFNATAMRAQNFCSGDCYFDFVEGDASILNVTIDNKVMPARGIKAFWVDDKSGGYHFKIYNDVIRFMDYEPTDENKKSFKENEYTYCFIKEESQDDYRLTIFFYPENERDTVNQKLAFAHILIDDIPGLSDYLKINAERLKDDSAYNDILKLIKGDNVSILPTLNELSSHAVQELFNDRIGVLNAAKIPVDHYCTPHYSIFWHSRSELLIKKIFELAHKEANGQKNILSELKFEELMANSTFLALLSMAEKKMLTESREHFANSYNQFLTTNYFHLKTKS